MLNFDKILCNHLLGGAKRVIGSLQSNCQLIFRLEFGPPYFHHDDPLLAITGNHNGRRDN